MFSKIIFSIASSSHKYSKEGRGDSSLLTVHQSIEGGGVFCFLFNMHFKKHLLNTDRKISHPLPPQSQ